MPDRQPAPARTVLQAFRKMSLQVNPATSPRNAYIVTQFETTVACSLYTNRLPWQPLAWTINSVIAPVPSLNSFVQPGREARRNLVDWLFPAAVHGKAFDHTFSHHVPPVQPLDSQ